MPLSVDVSAGREVQCQSETRSEREKGGRDVRDDDVPLDVEQRKAGCRPVLALLRILVDLLRIAAVRSLPAILLLSRGCIALLLLSIRSRGRFARLRCCCFSFYRCCCRCRRP